MKPLQVPSLDSDKETLSTFLCKPDIRKSYNKLLGVAKNYHNKLANNWFLNQCIDKEIIPQQFISKNHPKESKSQSFKDEWNDMTKQHSIELMKKALEDEVIRESEALHDVTSRFNLLL